MILDLTSWLNAFTIAGLWLDWFVAVTWQASVMVAVVMALDRALRARVWPQVLYGFWLLAFARIVLPPSLASPMSLIGWLTDAAATSAPAATLTPMDLGMPAYADAPVFPAQAPLPPAQAYAEPVLSTPVWPVVAFAIWVVGILILAGWIVTRLRRLSRVNRHELPVPEHVLAAAEHARTRLNLRRMPRIRVSDAVESASVFGFLRPTVFIPADLSPDDVTNVLLHEFAHIKRGDLVVHTVNVALLLLVWPNPFVWYALRRSMHVRELCTDATVSRVLREETPDYRTTLLNAARKYLDTSGGAWSQNQALGLLGLVEGPTMIVDRLRHLTTAPWKNLRVRIAVSLVAALAVGITVVPMSMSHAASEAPDDSQDAGPVTTRGVHTFSTSYGPDTLYHNLAPIFPDRPPGNPREWSNTTRAEYVRAYREAVRLADEAAIAYLQQAIEDGRVDVGDVRERPRDGSEAWLGREAINRWGRMWAEVGQQCQDTRDGDLLVAFMAWSGRREGARELESTRHVDEDERRQISEQGRIFAWSVDEPAVLIVPPDTVRVEAAVDARRTGVSVLIGLDGAVEEATADSRLGGTMRSALERSARETVWEPAVYEGEGARVTRRITVPVVPSYEPRVPRDSSGVFEFWMVDSPPRNLFQPEPVYPDSALAFQLEGDVFVELTVDTAGTVDTAVVLSGMPILHDAALAAARRCRFLPATRNGRPVPVYVRWRFAFRLDDDSEPLRDSRDGSSDAGSQLVPTDGSPYAVEIVDEAPACVYDALPRYPPDARAQQIEGSVYVDLVLGTDGLVESARVLRGPEALRDSALAAARRMRFTPARVDGQPVRVRMTQRVRIDRYTAVGNALGDSVRIPTDSWTEGYRRRFERELQRQMMAGRGTHFWTFVVRASSDPTSGRHFGARTLPDSLRPRAPFPSAASRPELRHWSGDKLAWPSRKPAPEYPEEAIARGVEGDALVEMHVGTDGNVRDAWAVKGPEVFRASALDAARQMRFRPMTLEGAPREFATFLTVRYRMASDVEATWPPRFEQVVQARRGGEQGPSSPPTPPLRPDGPPDTWSREVRLQFISDFKAYQRAVELFREQELAARRSGRPGQSPPEAYRPFATYSTPNDDSPMALWRVDEAPVMLNEAILDYPSAARAQGIEGDVFVECIVNRDGDTDDIRVVRGPEELRESAVSATRRTRFTPARYDGHPVSARIVRRVRFRLDGGDDSPRSPTDSDRRSELRRRAGEQRARYADSLSTYEVWTSPDPTESWPFGLRPVSSRLRPREPFPSAVDRPALMWWMADRTPVPLEHPKPNYPSEAVLQGLEGDVFIEMHVSKAGDVRNEWVVSGPEVFHESALAAAHRTLFPPARKNGVASAFAAFLTIRYRMDPESETGPSITDEVRRIEERIGSERSAAPELDVWLAELRAGGINAPTLPTAPRLTRPRLPNRPNGDPSTWDYDAREALRVELARYASAVGAERGKVTRYEGELRQFVYGLRRLLSRDAWEAHQPKLAGLTEGAQRLDAIPRGYSLVVEPLNDEYLAALPARPQLDDGSLTRINELDEEPRRVEGPDPVYPEAARRAGLECTVWWEAVLGVDGSLRDIRIVDGREEFFASARHVLENSRYTPGMLNGEPVAVYMAGFIPYPLDANETPGGERRSAVIRPPTLPSERPSRWSYDDALRYLSEFMVYHNALEANNETWLSQHADDPATWTPERFSREAFAWDVATARNSDGIGASTSWGEFLSYLRSHPGYTNIVPDEIEVQDVARQIGEYGWHHFADYTIQVRRLAAARWKERTGIDETVEEARSRVVALDVRIAELLSENAPGGHSEVYVRVRISPDGRTEYLNVEREAPPLADGSRAAIERRIQDHQWSINGYPSEIVVRFTDPVHETTQRLLGATQQGRIQRDAATRPSMTAEEASREVLTWEAARGRLRGNDGYWNAFLGYLRTQPKYDSMVPTDGEIEERARAIRGEATPAGRPRMSQERTRADARRLWLARAGHDSTHIGFRERKRELDARIAELLSRDEQRRYGSVTTHVSITVRVRIDPLGRTDYAHIEEEEPSALTDAKRHAITDLIMTHVWPMQGYPQDHAMGFSYSVSANSQTRPGGH